jgi:hypothetical protein
MLPPVAEDGLGKAEIEFAASVTAPLVWVLRDSAGDKIKGGSAFFLDTTAATFAVTACHVIEECFEDSKLPTFVQTMIGGRTGSPIPINLADRIIDANHDLDIATFRITPQELKAAGHTVLSGYQKVWPPRIAELDSGVTCCGFPGHSRHVPVFREIVFGIFAAACTVSSVNENTISVLIEREKLVQVHGDRAMQQDYDFGGISGGPLIAIVQTSTIRSWIPAGVIIQGPNPSGETSQSIQGFEMIKARPIQYICADGHLDVARWQMSNIHRV